VLSKLRDQGLEIVAFLEDIELPLTEVDDIVPPLQVPPTQLWLTEFVVAPITQP
ncbi:hypothetical protein U1Q18_033997, partial [Sarracenia purpurea var. burkii]